MNIRTFALAISTAALAVAGTAAAQDAPPQADQVLAQVGDQPQDLVGLARSFVQRVGGRLERADERELFALAPPREEAPPGPGEGIPDGEELILEVLIAELRFVESIFVIKRGTGVLVSLAEITEFIGFAIEVGDDPGRAAGWFIRESNTFELDFDAGILVIRGERREIEEGTLVFVDDEMFLHSSAFEDWFDVQMTVDFRNQTMILNPRNPLPLQERIARVEQFDRATENRAPLPSQPLLELPFRSITMPFLDVQIRGTRFSGQGQDTKTSSTYSVLGNGELAFATAKFFVTGSNLNPVSALRINLSREDPDGALLGPIQATKFEVGDLAGGAGGFGRGAAFTNSPQGFSNTTSNSTEFVGDIQPDWDVELYHNGVLVGLQQVGEEARYEFRNVPLFVGSNEFRLVFYGPQGELTETRSSIPVTTIGEANVRPIFNVSLNQRGWSVYRKPRPATGQSRAVVLSANVSDQIGEGVGATAGITISDVKKFTGTALSTGFNFGVFGTRLSTSFAYSIDAKALGVGGGFAGLLPGGQQYSVSSLFPNVSNGFRNSNSRVAFAGRIKILEDFEAPYRLNGAYVKTFGGITQSLAATTGTGFGRLNISLGNQWEKTAPIDEPAFTRFTGSLASSWSFFPITLRFGLNYKTIPKLKTTSLNGRFSWAIRRNWNASLSFDHQIAAASTRLQGSMSFVTEKVTLSPSFSATTVGDLFAFLTVRFSNAYDPKYGQSVLRSQRMSDRGAVVARVFLDANNNGVFDLGELPVPGARVQAIQANQGANTNENGFAFIVGLRKNFLTDVVVMEGSLIDPFWLPSFGGRAITPRAGSIHYLDFPIVETSEIEGRVLVLFPDTPGATPLPRITVQLVDAAGEIVDSKVSAFDGFFLFTRVMPGDYLVQADPEDARGFRLEAPEPTPLEAEQAVIHVVDIIVTPPDVIGFLTGGADGDAVVDLGAFQSVTGANIGWLLLQRQYSGLLGGLARMQPTHPATPGLPDSRHTVFAGPLTPRQADQVCERLSAQGQACSVQTSVVFADLAG